MYIKYALRSNTNLVVWLFVKQLIKSLLTGVNTSKIQIYSIKHLIIGNHDRFLEDRQFDRSLFRSIEHYSEIKDCGRTVILSHYPIFCYKGQYRRATNGDPMTYMLYGHVHNTHDELLVNQFIMQTRATMVQSKYADRPEPIPCHMINCFCMFSNYTPLTLDEWIRLDKSRRAALERVGEE